MRRPLKLFLAVITPAAAIISGLLTQVALQALWPGIQHVDIGGITVDSYIAVGAIFVFSALSGRWLRLGGLRRFSLIASFLVPFAWLLGLMYEPHSPLALSVETLLFVAAGAAPLIGLAVGLGFTSPSNA